MTCLHLPYAKLLREASEAQTSAKNMPMSLDIWSFPALFFGSITRNLMVCWSLLEFVWFKSHGFLEFVGQVMARQWEVPAVLCMNSAGLFHVAQAFPYHRRQNRKVLPDWLDQEEM